MNSGDQKSDPTSGTPQVSEQLIEAVRYQVCKIKIKARLDTVWQVLTDYRRLPQVFAIMTQSKVQSQSQTDGSKVLEQKVQPLPPFPAVPYVVRVTETNGSLLKWQGLTAYIKVNEGHFCLEPIPGDQGTLAAFAIRLEAPLLAPGFLIRQQLKSIMPQVLLTLKAYSEKIGKI